MSSMVEALIRRRSVAMDFEFSILLFTVQESDKLLARSTRHTHCR